MSAKSLEDVALSIYTVWVQTIRGAPIVDDKEAFASAKRLALRAFVVAEAFQVVCAKHMAAEWKAQLLSCGHNKQYQDVNDSKCRRCEGRAL